MRAPVSIVVASVMLDQAIGLSLIAAFAAVMGLASGGARSAARRDVGGHPFDVRRRALGASAELGLFGAFVERAAASDFRTGADLSSPSAGPSERLRWQRALASLNAAVQFVVIRGLVFALGYTPSAEGWVLRRHCDGLHCRRRHPGATRRLGYSGRGIRLLLWVCRSSERSRACRKSFVPTLLVSFCGGGSNSSSERRTSAHGSTGKHMNVSIVVPAHNEAGNIRRLLTSLIEQDTRVARIVEIVVVASGCTDNTAELAREFGRGRPGLHVHVQERREGKVAAINMFMRQRDPRAEVIVICSADLDPGRDVIEKLVCCLRDRPEVGMVRRPADPELDDARRLVGRMVQLLSGSFITRCPSKCPRWEKIVAFRAHLVEHVSGELSVVDEASIEDIVQGKGYTLGYVADALVTNHGPERIGEYFEQRRRIARGHYWLDFAFGYEVATLDRGLLAKAVLGVMRRQDRFGKLALAAAIGTEVAARAFGLWDARVVGGKHRTWQALQSTKQLGGEANGAAPAAGRPRRLSARPDPLEAIASRGAVGPDPTRAIPPLRAPKIDAKLQAPAVDRAGKRP